MGDGEKSFLSLQAISGQAIDRHLLGLKMIAVEGKVPLPAIFTDAAYSKALHYRLSTSQVGMSRPKNGVTAKIQD